MSSKPFPDSHTTQTSTTTAVIIRPTLEFSYLKTLPGILKIVEIALDFLVFICVVAGPFPAYGGVGWGSFVSITAFIATFVLLVLYLFHVIEIYNVVPWLLVEMTFCALTTFCYLIASFVMAAGAGRWSNLPRMSAWVVAAEMILCAVWALFFFIAACVLASDAAYIGNHFYTVASPGPFAAGSFFGFVVMGCYGFDCFLKFQAWRSGQVAQGEPRNTPAMHSVATVN